MLWGYGRTDYEIFVIVLWSKLIDEKSARFLEYLVEFFGGDFSDRFKADALLYREKSLRPNETRLADVAAFTIAVVQWHGKSIPVPASGDLAKNQIRTGKIGDH
jgi:hypothetical protein